MSGKRFRALLLYDINCGFQSNRGKWIFALLIQVYFCILAGQSGSISKTGVGFLERMTFIFWGLPEYHMSETGRFELPVHWLIFHSFLLFLVGFYPTNELSNSGGQALVRSGNRKYWLLSKTIWVCLTVAAYYLLLAAVLAVCSVGAKSSPASMLSLFGVDLAGMSQFKIIIHWWLMPLLNSAAMCLVESILSLFIEPVLSFFVMLGYLVASVFWTSPIFSGNYSMLQREDFVSGNLEISCKNCLLVCLTLIVIAYSVGIKFFNNKDILLSQGGQQ